MLGTLDWDALSQATRADRVTVIDVSVPSDLVEPFRRDALKRPVRKLPKFKKYGLASSQRSRVDEELGVKVRASFIASDRSITPADVARHVRPGVCDAAAFHRGVDAATDC
jgi:hypothetical protein